MLHQTPRVPREGEPLVVQGVGLPGKSSAGLVNVFDLRRGHVYRSK